MTSVSEELHFLEFLRWWTARQCGATTFCPQTMLDSVPKSPSKQRILLQKMIHHGVLGYYGHFLKQEKHLDSFPAEFRAEIELSLKQQWLTNLKIAQLQDFIVQIFDQIQLSYLILKGLPLSERLYGHALLRSCGDVDVWVSERDFGKAIEILKKSGFSIRKSEHLFHETLTHKNFSGSLELHWKFSDQRAQFNENEIFQRSHSQILSGKNYRVMNENDEFLYIAYQHATNYLQYRVSWYFDLMRFLILNQRQLSEELILHRAQEFQIMAFVQASLDYCRQFNESLFLHLPFPRRLRWWKMYFPVQNPLDISFLKWSGIRKLFTGLIIARQYFIWAVFCFWRMVRKKETQPKHN